LSDGKYVSGERSLLELDGPNAQTKSWGTPASNCVCGRPYVVIRLLNGHSFLWFRYRPRECRWRNRRGELFTVLAVRLKAINPNEPAHAFDGFWTSPAQNQAEKKREGAGPGKANSAVSEHFFSILSARFPHAPLGINPVFLRPTALRDFFPQQWNLANSRRAVCNPSPYDTSPDGSV